MSYIPTTLSERAYQTVRSMILRDDLQAGQWLRKRALAEEAISKHVTAKAGDLARLRERFGDGAILRPQESEEQHRKVGGQS